MYERYGKRLLDIILSLAATIILAIPMGLVALWIKLDSPGPVFFKQRRIGKGKTHFNILKFRTMRGDTPHDVPTHLLKDADSYITGSGAFLRKTSLDELPQIYNILAGQMSVIGPRPALYNQYDLIEARDKVRANDIRPGLTGLAQVNGRDELPIDVKARYDGEYAAHVTFWNDVKIFFRSITYVFQRRGVVEGGHRCHEPDKRGKIVKMTDVVPAGKTPAGTLFCAEFQKMYKKIISIFVKICCKSQADCVKIYIMMILVFRQITKRQLLPNTHSPHCTPVQTV